MEGGMAAYPVATPKSRCRRGRIGVQPSPQRRSQVVGPFPLARGLSQTPTRLGRQRATRLMPRESPSRKLCRRTHRSVRL
nr:uncharacterized protein LOC103247406 isoform X3 [Chlorocebus sabaeus]